MTTGRVEIVVRGSGWTGGSAVLSGWLVLAAVGACAGVSEQAQIAILAAGPAFGVVALWAATTWRVVIATATDLRVIRRPIGLWDVVRIARRDLAFVALEPVGVRAPDAPVRWWERGERWAVVARTRAGRAVTLASGYRDPVAARRVVDEVSRVMGV